MDWSRRPMPNAAKADNILGVKIPVLILLSFAAIGCTRPSGMARITFTIGPVSPYPTFLRWPGWPRSLPSSALEHDCYLVSVSGPGVPSSHAAADFPSGYSADCMGWGVSTPMLTSTEMTAGVALDVPTGVSRRVAFFGTETDGLGCSAIQATDQLEGMTKRVHVLGEKVTSIFKDEAIELVNLYSSTDPIDQVALCAPAPVLDSAPSTAAVGSIILIDGSGFLTAPTIQVGSSTCTSSIAISATQAGCTVPTGLIGPQTLTLTNRGGKSAQLERTINITQTLIGSFAFVEKAAINFEGINHDISLHTQYPILTEHSGSLWAGFSVTDSPNLILASVFDPATPTWNPDDDATPGLNINSGLNGTQPYFHSHQGDLYGLWLEDSLIRAARYTGAGAWAQVDDTGVASTPDLVPPRLVSLGTRLFGAFILVTAVTEARLYEFDGTTTWSAVDGGGTELNPILGDVDRIDVIAHNGEVWAAWADDTGGTSTENVYVRSYDPTTPGWTDRSTGMGRGSTASEVTIVEHEGDVYVAWVEEGPAKVFVSRYDSATSWTSVETSGGIIENGNGAQHPTMVSFQGRLYLAFSDYNGTNLEIQVYRYDSPGNWTAISGTAGENHTAGSQAENPFFYVFDNELYLTFDEEKTGAGSFPHQIRVKRGEP